MNSSSYLFKNSIIQSHLCAQLASTPSTSDKHFNMIHTKALVSGILIKALAHNVLVCQQG